MSDRPVYKKHCWYQLFCARACIRSHAVCVYKMGDQHAGDSVQQAAETQKGLLEEAMRSVDEARQAFEEARKALAEAADQVLPACV